MANSPDDPMILVGRVAGSFGVRGEVRIATYTEDPLSIAAFKTLKRQDGSTALTIASARKAKDGVVCRCAGVDTKEAADARRVLGPSPPASPLPGRDEDEFYLTALVGLTVRHIQTDVLLGRVKSVQNFG